MLLASLVGCAGVQRPARSWDEFPLQLALSSELSNCQVETMHAAAERLEQIIGRDLFELRMVPVGHLAVNGLPAYRVVGVSPGRLSSPMALDDTTVHFDEADGRMHSADIRVGQCSLRAYLHELAHALGLDHVEARGLLMREEHDESAMELPPAAIQAVLIGTVTRKALTQPMPRRVEIMATKKSDR